MGEKKEFLVYWRDDARGVFATLEDAEAYASGNVISQPFSNDRFAVCVAVADVSGVREADGLRVIRIVRNARPSEAEVTPSHLRALALRLESRPCAPSLDGYDLADGLRAAADLLAGEPGPAVQRDEAAGGSASPRVSLATYAGLVPSQQPSEAEAVAVLRDMFATWDARGIICVAAFDRARRVLAGAGPDPMPLREQPSPGTLAHLRADLRDMAERLEKAEAELSAETSRADEWKALAIKTAAECSASESGRLETDELLAAETARAEKAEGLLIQRETELRLAREDGAAVERQMREARGAADASFVRANRAEARAEKAERELAQVGEAAFDQDSGPGEAPTPLEAVAGLRARVEKAGAKAEGQRLAAHNALDRAEQAERELAKARAEVARLTAQPETKGRATDEELVAIGREAYDEGILEGVPHVPWLYRIVRAVAARVRQEPGILERLVAAPGVRSVTIWRCPGGTWGARVNDRSSANNLDAADVFAALARLAGLK
jgi:hypothetical protein